MATAWSVIFPLLQSGTVKPIVAKTFPLAEDADALLHLVEGRPFSSSQSPRWMPMKNYKIAVLDDY
jgi:hypothetical protein